MVYRLDVKQSRLLDTIGRLERLPGTLTRFRRSALKRTGFFISSRLKEYLLKGPPSWPEAHPLTQRFRSKYKEGQGRWVKRRKPQRKLVQFLAKFVRYRVNRRGTAVQIDFGKTRRGEPGKPDPKLSVAARRITRGAKIRVTKKMRRFWAATKRKRPKRQKKGVDFFPLSPKTSTLIVPPRPIIDPFFAQEGAKFIPQFERFLLERIRRFNREGK